MLTIKAVGHCGHEAVFEADRVRRIMPDDECSAAPCVQAEIGGKLVSLIYFESEMSASPRDGVEYHVATVVFVMNDNGATVATYRAEPTRARAVIGGAQALAA